MAYTDYDYDRYANNPANFIENEIHVVNVDVDRSIFLEHGAFYDDQNGLVLEGRQGAGAWELLNPEVDYQYSPLFLQAAAKTGKQVFSYLILIKSYDSVRVTYRALGKFEDTILLANVATSSIDRSKIHAWDTIWAPSEYYNPRARDVDLHDKTSLEVFNEAIQRLLISISNPLSSSVLTTADVTKLQQQVGNAVTTDDLTAFPTRLSSEPIQLSSDVPDVILNLGSEVTTASFIVSFTADDGRVQAFHALIVRNGDIIDQTIYGEVLTDDDMVTFRTSVTAEQILVSLTSEFPGTARAKLIFSS